MSRAFFSVNSNAALRVPEASVSTPSRVDVRTIVSTSSRANALVASFFGSTRNSRSGPLAIALSATMIGRNTVATATRGGARRSTARSGIENDTFLGTISPSTTCR